MKTCEPESKQPEIADCGKESIGIKSKQSGKKVEKFALKSVDRVEAENMATLANFYKLYANTEGFAVADKNVNGGLFYLKDKNLY